MITKVLRVHHDAVLPEYSYAGDAGMDLHVVGQHTLGPGESKDLPTGIAVEMPLGYWGRITGRSSTFRKRGLSVLEGVIDSGFRGELFAFVTNTTPEPVFVASGERLAQLILQAVVQAPAKWVLTLESSARGDNGFGSTGNAHRSPPLAFPEPEATAGPFVYLGGAVDYDDDGHHWRHDAMWDGLATYCPICACGDLTKPSDIIERNGRALLDADIAVFVLEGYSLGTPIEAWTRIVEMRRDAILTPGRGAGVYHQYMSERPGVSVADSLPAAALLVRERFGR